MVFNVNSTRQRIHNRSESRLELEWNYHHLLCTTPKKYKKEMNEMPVDKPVRDRNKCRLLNAFQELILSCTVLSCYTNIKIEM